jgi:hypothetical protein
LAALKWLEDHDPVDTLNVQVYSEGQFPKEDPHWDPNDNQDYQWCKQYQEVLFGGMKDEGKKAINMSKTSEVFQGPDDSPSQFYEWLCEAFHLYTLFNPRQLKTRG